VPPGRVFCSFDHIHTILRRAAANTNGRPRTILSTLLWFKLATMFEGVRSKLARSPEGETRAVIRAAARKSARLLSAVSAGDRRQGSGLLVGLSAFSASAESGSSAPDRMTYTDVSTAPPEVDEVDNLDLYHATSGGEAALARKRRDDALRERAR
jgi:hypothetical protein